MESTSLHWETFNCFPPSWTWGQPTMCGKNGKHSFLWDYPFWLCSLACIFMFRMETSHRANWSKWKPENRKINMHTELKLVSFLGQTISGVCLGFESHSKTLICFVCSCAWLFVWGKFSSSWAFSLSEAKSTPRWNYSGLHSIQFLAKSNVKEFALMQSSIFTNGTQCISVVKKPAKVASGSDWVWIWWVSMSSQQDKHKILIYRVRCATFILI